MKHARFLLPHWCLPCGLVLLGLGVVGVCVELFFEDVELTVNMLRSFFGLDGLPAKVNNLGQEVDGTTNLLPTVARMLLLIGGVMAGFARFRKEDEFIEQLRYESLTAAIYLYVLALLVLLVFFWGVAYLLVLHYLYCVIVLFYLILFYLRVALSRCAKE